MSAISANMADLSRYAADIGLMSAISANMADLSRYAADVGLMAAISADQCRSSADVGPTCEAIWECNNVLADRGDFKMVLKKLLNGSRVASCSS